jgi:hypothetical protein
VIIFSSQPAEVDDELAESSGRYRRTTGRADERPRVRTPLAVFGTGAFAQRTWSTSAAPGADSLGSAITAIGLSY